jgi:hypothetical protein
MTCFCRANSPISAARTRCCAAWCARGVWCVSATASMAAPSSRKLSGKPILYSPNGFVGAARQALNKLGVRWEPTEAERAYNEGRFDAGAGKSGRAGEGTFLAAAPLWKCGACA